MACEAGIIPVVLGGDSSRWTTAARNGPHPRQRRLIFARDKTCRAEGCEIPANWCHVHHEDPWLRAARPASRTASPSARDTTPPPTTPATDQPTTRRPTPLHQAPDTDLTAGPRRRCSAAVEDERREVPVADVRRRRTARPRRGPPSRATAAPARGARRRAGRDQRGSASSRWRRASRAAEPSAKSRWCWARGRPTTTRRSRRNEQRARDPRPVRPDPSASAAREPSPGPRAGRRRREGLAQAPPEPTALQHAQLRVTVQAR